MMENFAPIIQAMKGKNPQDILMTMTRNMPINNPFISNGIIYDTFDPSSRIMWCAYKVK